MEGQLTEKVACLECGQPVSKSLASRREGLCLRCSAKRNSFFVFYSSLIERVCHSPGGLDTLSDAKKLNYALTLFKMRSTTAGFINFSSTVPALNYELIENGLVTFNEPRTLRAPASAGRLKWRRGAWRRMRETPRGPTGWWNRRSPPPR